MLWWALAWLSLAGFGTYIYILIAKDQLHKEAEKLDENRKLKEENEVLQEFVDTLVRGAQSSRYSYPFLNGLDRWQIASLKALLVDVELSLRLSRQHPLKDKLDCAKAALHSIYDLSCEIGCDSGHSGIVKIVTDALEKLDG